MPSSRLGGEQAAEEAAPVHSCPFSGGGSAQVGNEGEAASATRLAEEGRQAAAAAAGDAAWSSSSSSSSSSSPRKRKRSLSQVLNFEPSSMTALRAALLFAFVGTMAVCLVSMVGPSPALFPTPAMDIDYTGKGGEDRKHEMQDASLESARPLDGPRASPRVRVVRSQEGVMGRRRRLRVTNRRVQEAGEEEEEEERVVVAIVKDEREQSGEEGMAAAAAAAAAAATGRERASADDREGGDLEKPVDRQLDGVTIAGGGVGSSLDGSRYAALASSPVPEIKRALNEMVHFSKEKTEEQHYNIAFIKTHKTASTTFTSVLYRYGARHDRVLARYSVKGTAVTLPNALKNSAETGLKPDIMHYHHAWNGFYQDTWTRLENEYRQLMRAPNPHFVTVLREPVAHYLSYYYFFMHPNNKIPIDQYVKTGGTTRKHRVMHNPLCAEFGIYTIDQLRVFLEKDLPKFTLILLTERFDEGLVLFKRMFNWDLIDLTYSTILENKGGDATRWDGKKLTKAPKISMLSPKVLARIEDLTSLDRRLYAGVLEHYEDVMEKHGENIDIEVEQLRDLQKAVAAVLDDPQGGSAHDWYRPERDEFFYFGIDYWSGKAIEIEF